MLEKDTNLTDQVDEQLKVCVCEPGPITRPGWSMPENFPCLIWSFLILKIMPTISKSFACYYAFANTLKIHMNLHCVVYVCTCIIMF